MQIQKNIQIVTVNKHAHPDDQKSNLINAQEAVALQSRGKDIPGVKVISDKISKDAVFLLDNGPGLDVVDMLSHENGSGLGTGSIGDIIGRSEKLPYMEGLHSTVNMQNINRSPVSKSLFAKRE